MPDVDAEKVSIEEAMSRNVYGVGPDELLLSAVIRHHGKVVGIFTVIDALRVWDEALEAMQRGDGRLD